MARLIVTCAPPTSNGDLHLGHLAGPYLASDVFTRTRRLFGDDVHYISYSDDYQSYVVRKALAQQREPESVAREYGPLMGETLAKAHIKLDHFMHTLGLRDHYLEALRTFYFALRDRGALLRQRVTVPFSREHQLWGYEAFARGTCPSCGEQTDASQCEGCAMPPDLTRMRDVRCVIDGTAMEWTKVEQLFLNVEANREVLSELYGRAPFRPALRQFASALLGAPFLPWAISRPHDWGPRVPDDPAAILHTWFGGIAGYYAASREWANSQNDEGLFTKYWSDKETQLIHFVGIDCAYSHIVAYPILLAHLPVAPTVTNIVTNQFLSLHGNDFSTSRGIAIWANEFLDEIDVDAARLYLALRAPETTEQDFDLDDFRKIINEKFATALNQAIERLPHAGTGNFDAAPVSTSVGDVLQNLRQRFIDASAPATFSMNAQATLLVDLIDLMASVDPAQIRMLVSIYSVLARPIQPGFSGRLARYLGLADEWGSSWLVDGGDLPPAARSPLEGQVPSIQPVASEVISKFRSRFEAAVRAA
ncbi:Methionine-tRNA ligase [Agrobacterium sp. DSM 25558]|uniref:class I tRNA ligase family protein n=1 Tax=Agrobacterium sp. DSM 25558 TaxID=1907665 RepID=UPI00097259F1|nr:class I tRNA ligase family protein [Agrobacterium sp. DSM 25558]SCX22972.1 Methionine-tRNA ligase [Agrobacterium sp. DSM 25558]